MADSFDTTTPEGRIRQFMTLLGAEDMPLDKVEEFLDRPRPELSNGEIKTARDMIAEDVGVFDTLLNLARFERTQGVPDILGMKPSP